MMLGQKLQLGFIAIMFALAGFFFYRNAQVQHDLSINSWTTARAVGADPHKSITASNPEDPKKKELVNGFGCVDGWVEVIEHPDADPPKNKQVTVTFRPETRGASHPYEHFHDPMAPVSTFKDPLKHALALATYSSVYRASLGLLGAANMTADQRAKELDARNAMKAAITVVDGRVEDGTFHTELLDKIAAALNAYKAKSGDPTKDAAKSELAWKVLESAANYYNKQQEEKDQAIDIYMKVITDMLSDDQKDKLITAVDDYERGHPANQVTRRGRGAARSNGSTVNLPARGIPAAQAPGRGRAATAPAH